MYDNYCHLLCRCRRHSIRSDFLQKLFLTHSVAVVFTTPGIFFVNASQAEPGRNPRSRLGFFFLFCARVESGCLSSRQPRKTARSPVLLLVLAVFFLVWIRGGKLVRIGMPGFLVSNTATDDSPLPRKKVPFEHQVKHEVEAHGQKGKVVPGAQQDGKSQGGQGQQARRGQSCGHPRRCGGLHPGAQ